MKKFITEYVNILGYVVTGLVFSVAVFILFINFYHYKEVNAVYIKDINYQNRYDGYMQQLNKIKNNINSYNNNSYAGSYDKAELLKVQSRLQLCTNKYQGTDINKIFQKDSVNMQDNYKLYLGYQTDIVNECDVMQLYSLDTTKLPGFNNIKPFVELNVKTLTSNLDYLKKSMQNNSSYQFSSDFDKANIFDITRDSYTTIEKSYAVSLDLLEAVSEWYRKVVAGEI